jgi:hypothetical protein
MALTGQDVVGLMLSVAFIGVEQLGAISGQRQMHPDLESDAVVRLTTRPSQTAAEQRQMRSVMLCCTSKLVCFSNTQSVSADLQGDH